MYVKTIGPTSARIMLVGEAPGEEEDRTGKPFMGPAGKTLNRLLDEAGITRAECLIANVARERPPGNKIAFYFEDKKMRRPKPILQDWIATLKKEIEMYRPNIVVALGATAMWALTGERGIATWRGYISESSLVPGQKVLTTYHPQKVNYEWKLGFTVIMDLRKARINSVVPEIPVDSRRLNAFPSRREFLDYLNWLMNDHTGPISLDVETAAGPGSHIDIVGIADSHNHALSFTFLSNRTPRMEQLKELEVWHKIAQVLDKKEVIMHNGAYDLAVLWQNLGIMSKHFKYDTLIAGHVCWPEMPRSLAYMTSICLNVPAWKHTSTTMPSLYNCADAANTYGVWTVMENEIEKLKLWDTFHFEMEQIIPATMLQLQGLPVDIGRRNTIKANIRTRLAILEEELTQAFGREVNLRSPKQLQSLLYVDMGLPVQYKRRQSKYDSKKITADAEALNKLMRITDNPLLLKILEVKKLEKLMSFIDIDVSPEGKVHTSYNVTGATMLRTKKGLIVDDEESYKSFGRWSSSKSIILPYGSGNLQNIPYTARTMYTAGEGYSFIQADYVQAEAVVVAFCIGDEPMKEMFRKSFGMSPKERKEKNYDIHKLTASNNFLIPIDRVSSAQREIGKTIRHATNYSAGPGVLSSRLGCSMSEAKKLLNQFHDTCPQLRLWHMRIQDELRRTRILTNLLGRKHRFVERWGDQLFRSAYSYIPQSTVGDLLNRSLVKIYQDHGDKIHIYLQLHDAIYVRARNEDIEWTIEKMRECMLCPLTADGETFTIDVDFSVGPSWGELEEI